MIAVERARDEEEIVPRESEADAQGDALATLYAELEGARTQADEYLDQLQRTAAQFSNYKKRIDREQSEFTRLAGANLLTRLLPVVDDFERAFETMPPQLGGATWTEGLALIYRKLQQILLQEGVEIIGTEAQPFDPQLHQAVTYEEAAGFGEGQIIAEVQKGYRIGERVLRPSMVRVAR